MHAAGAPMIIILHEQFPPYIPSASLGAEEESACFEAWLSAIEAEGMVASRSQVKLHRPPAW